MGMVAPPEVAAGIIGKMGNDRSRTDPLHAKLKKAWRRERLSIHCGGLSLVLALAVPLLLSLFVLDRMLDLPREARWGLLALASGVFIWRVSTRWFFRLRRYDGLAWASRVEQAFPGLNSLLVNYVELVRSNPAATGSEELFGVVKTQALEAAKPLDFGKTVDFREPRSLMKWVILALAGFAGMYWFFSDLMKLAAHRYLGANIPYPTATQLVGIPKGQNIAEGADILLAVQAEGQIPAKGFIHVRSEGSESWRKIEIPRNGAAEFAYSMGNMEEGFAFFFEIGDAVSHTQEKPGIVTVVSPPRVVSQELSVTPPNYTGLEPFTTENLASTVPAGSQLAWVVTMSAPVTEARLDGPEKFSQEGIIEGDRTTLRFAFAADTPGMYHLRPKGATLGLETEGLTYRLNLREDLEPRASLVAPGSSVKATANKSLSLTVRASDDYGLSEFAILYRVNGGENQQRISLGVPPSNDSQQDLGHPRSGTWPLQWNIPEDLPNLQGGDFLEVAIEVTEVAADPSKARKAVTRTCGIEILSISDYQAYITSRFDALQTDLAETERQETLIRHALEASLQQTQDSQK